MQYKASDLLDKSRTDWERFDALTDAEIDVSEIPELDDEWFKNADLIYPKERKAVSLQVDLDVLGWFKSKSSKGYQKLMNAVLKAYVHAQKSK